MESTTGPPIDGFILVGGASRRFGSDKAAALLDGIPLVQRAANLLRGSGWSVHLVGSAARDYRVDDALWVTDEEPGRGPAAALAACLRRARTWALVLAVDMPWVTPDLLANLASRRVSQDPLAICFRDAGGRRHPFPGLYHRDLLSVPGGVQPGSMQAILDRERTLLLDLDGLEGALRNANRPEDLGS